MRALIPCSDCGRHVHATDAACPFCGATIAQAADRPQPPRRLSRAAALVFGASVAVVGCGDETVVTSSSSSSGTTGGGTTSSGGQGGMGQGGDGGMGQGGRGQGGRGQGGRGQGGEGGRGDGGMGQGGEGGDINAPLYGAAPPPPED